MIQIFPVSSFIFNSRIGKLDKSNSATKWNVSLFLSSLLPDFISHFIRQLLIRLSFSFVESIHISHLVRQSQTVQSLFLFCGYINKPGMFD